MTRRLGWALLGVAAGYVISAGLGGVLTSALSINAHDEAVEIATTSALVTGPIGALIGLVTGLEIGRRR